MDVGEGGIRDRDGGWNRVFNEQSRKRQEKGFERVGGGAGEEKKGAAEKGASTRSLKRPRLKEVKNQSHKQFSLGCCTKEQRGIIARSLSSINGDKDLTT